MAPWQSETVLIALGVTYFISHVSPPRLIACYSTSNHSADGLAIQIAGLLALIATFRRLGNGEYRPDAGARDRAGRLRAGR